MLELDFCGLAALHGHALCECLDAAGVDGRLPGPGPDAPAQRRRLDIDVSDLGLHWVLELRDGRLRTSDAIADASVRGSATDLLLLASRLQRRLLLPGNTELGLTVRNLLDRLPWESVPLGLRNMLHRGATRARAARDAHHGRTPAGC